MPALLDAVDRLYREQAVNVVLPASSTTGAAFFEERIGRAPIQVIEGESWDAMAHADLALAASGTVTVEAALLGTPMVTFYKVTLPSWVAGKFLVQVPFYSMVNLIAGRAVVPELMQGEMTGEALAREARRLLTDERARAEMKAGLAEVARKLAGREPHRGGRFDRAGNFGRTSCSCFVIAGFGWPPWRPASCCWRRRSRRPRSAPRSRIDVRAVHHRRGDLARHLSPSRPRRPCGSSPLDDNITSAAFELNNALNVSKVVDDKGKQIPGVAQRSRISPCG